MKKITKKYKRPKIIAEISGNHNGNKKRFLKLIEQACINGADLIKIQTYEPKDITLKQKNIKFKIQSGLWKNKNLWSLYSKACTPFNWHKDAFRIAKKYKKKIFSSPFSIRAVDLLEKFNCSIYKIASFEITDYKLIDYIASKNKKIILSTGMSKISEIKGALKIINKYHNNVSILHCISNYPTEIRDSNLEQINHLKKNFKNYEIGLSDHTNGISTSILAAQMGVVFIEKHFNLDELETSDSSFSINPNQLKELNDAINLIFNQKVTKKNLNRGNLFLRRSIFASKKIKRGDIITKKNINTLRPKIGICASNYFKILNKVAKTEIKKNEPIFFKSLK